MDELTQVWPSQLIKPELTNSSKKGQGGMKFWPRFIVLLIDARPRSGKKTAIVGLHSTTSHGDILSLGGGR